MKKGSGKKANPTGKKAGAQGQAGGSNSSSTSQGSSAASEGHLITREQAANWGSWNQEEKTQQVLGWLTTLKKN